tara:strand:- start:1603 stop:2079 length:477 start_codon:yes stop_codon:yes gene_type:complete
MCYHNAPQFTGGYKAAEAALWSFHADGIRATAVFLGEALLYAQRPGRGLTRAALEELRGIFGSDASEEGVGRWLEKAMRNMRTKLNKEARLSQAAKDQPWGRHGAEAWCELWVARGEKAAAAERQEPPQVAAEVSRARAAVEVAAEVSRARAAVEVCV